MANPFSISLARLSSRQKRTKDGGLASPFLCVGTRKTIKRQVSQFQRHLQTFYAPFFVCGCVPVPLCVSVCVCVQDIKCKKFLPIESYVSRSRITETSRTNYQGIPKKVREKLNYLCLWSPWWRSFGVCMCVSEWLCEYAHKSMQRILIENVCRKCDHHSKVLGWDFTWWWSGQTKSENSKLHKK